ncbi:hypothetical protein KC722_02115 [Candidatus Kaiserbacteria bacterium]|nr:hypothetical protein [Candidatus Kaiserbacteria bacterium]MCB9811538.1 hypothetical protein [Candidatus Nomurabacteria bacterium]
MFFKEEFRLSFILQVALAALVFCYFMVFADWVSRSAITLDSVINHAALCPTYFQSCESLYFLRALPDGYSQSMWYMLLFGSLIVSAYFLICRRWSEAQWILLPAYVWHTLNVFVLTYYGSGNYEYYVFVFGTILFFFPHKEFFLKLTLVLFYVMSTAAKIHPAWIAGGYFTNMSLGLPVFPEWSIPLFTNLVIVMEMVGAWFLLSKHPLVQRTVLLFFVIFHLYSGVLVEYRYPATVLPMLLIAFGPWYRYQKPPLDKKSVIGWTFIGLLCILQLTPKMVVGDEKLTLEANKYGLYMFESNHQCIVSAEYIYTDGHVDTYMEVHNNPRFRCDPYMFWYRFNHVCEQDPRLSRIAWTFDHSINGDPFLRIVDTDNACDLEYKPFSHNEWIKTYTDNPEVIGWPAQNDYH